MMVGIGLSLGLSYFAMTHQDELQSSTAQIFSDMGFDAASIDPANAEEEARKILSGEVKGEDIPIDVEAEPAPKAAAAEEALPDMGTGLTGDIKRKIARAVATIKDTKQRILSTAGTVGRMQEKADQMNALNAQYERGELTEDEFFQKRRELHAKKKDGNAAPTP